jgi:hypothetical protein
MACSTLTPNLLFLVGNPQRSLLVHNVTLINNLILYNIYISIVNLSSLTKTKTNAISVLLEKMTLLSIKTI